MKQERIKTRILVPFAVGLALLLGIFIWNTYRQGKRRNHEDLEKYLDTAQSLLASFLEKDAAMMDATLDVVMKDERLRAAFEREDVEALLSRVGPLFEELRDEHRVTHFYFTGPDRVNLLRVHQPDQGGDTIVRFTTLEAERTGKPARGIELGPLGTFTSRVVHPWHDGERLIGYVELGEDIGHVIEGLHDSLHVELYPIISKGFLDRKRWEVGMRMIGHKAQWDRLPDSVIVRQGQIPAGLIAILDQRRNGDIRFKYHLDSGGRDCRVGFLPLVDAGGRTVGELAVQLDVTEQVAASRRSIVAAAAICVASGSLLFILFCVLLGRVERDLSSARRRAAQEARSREEDQAKHTEEIRGHRDQLQAMIDAIPSPLMVIDRDYRIRLANRAVREFAGGVDPAGPGLTCHSVSHGRDTPCDGHTEPCPLRRAVEEKKAVRVSHKHCDSQGKEHVVDITATPVFDQSGEVSHIIESCYDVTERVQALEELRLQGSALESAANAIAITDRRGCITWVNLAFTRLTGFSRDEAVGETPGILRSGRHDEAFYRNLRDTIASGRVWHGEMVDRRKDGSLYTVDTTITPVPDKEGQISHFVAIQQDVTQRKRTEAELENAKLAAETANRAKSEFLANMSHEIRTPMTAILGFSDLLLQNVEEAEHRESLDTIKRNGDHLLQLINNILDLSKIEAGKLEIEQIRCSPRQIVAEVVSLMNVRAGAKNLPVEIDYQGPIPQSIQTDPMRFREILLNLVGNAIKFTEVGEVRVAVRLLADQVDVPRLQIEVIDTGIGISREQSGELFEPFAQGDTSTTRTFGGTGLGLAISKRLAEMLGGKIGIRSVPGEGSTFTLTLETGRLEGVRMLDDPAGAEDRLGQPEKSPGSRGDRLGGRILLAEDGPDNQRLISFLLKKAGAEVTVAENGQIAIDCVSAAEAEGKPFDVVLMDMQMPVLDGYQATGKLRAEGYTGPIIALTAHAMTSDRQKCLDAGCDDYLSKPVDRERLIQMVCTHLSGLEAGNPR